MSELLIDALGAVEAEGERKKAWLARRRTMITATDAAKIVGVSKYGGPMDVYLDKLGQLPELADNDRLRAGRRFERPILDWYADSEGVLVHHNEPYHITPSPVFDWIGATLDALRVEPNVISAPVDAKNIAFQGKEWGDPGTDEMPLYYAAQLIMQMHVTGADFADLAVVFGGNRLAVYRLHRNPTLENDILERCSAFWANHVMRRVPPPVDGSQGYTDYLTRTLRKTSELVKEADFETNEVVMALKEVKERIEAEEERKAHYNNLIRVAIGTGKTIVGKGWRATWSQSEDGVAVDWEQVARALASTLDGVADYARRAAPDLQIASFKDHVAQFSTPKLGGRRLLVTYKGD